jgi:hypothetical protein
VSTYRLDDRCSIIGRDYCLRNRFHINSEPTHTPIKKYVGVKWPEIEADHSSPSSGEVKNAWGNFGVLTRIQICDEWNGEHKQTVNGQQAWKLFSQTYVHRAVWLLVLSLHCLGGHRVFRFVLSSILEIQICWYDVVKETNIKAKKLNHKYHINYSVLIRICLSCEKEYVIGIVGMRTPCILIISFLFTVP